MRSTKLGLFLSLSLCMLGLTGISAWGAPFTGTGIGPTPAQAQQTKPNQTQPMPDQMQPPPSQEQPKADQAQSATFTGTVVKDGEGYVLKDASGQVYKLDDSSRAQSFEGKSVKVTGKLDTEAKLIHVESIEAAA